MSAFGCDYIRYLYVLAFCWPYTDNKDVSAWIKIQVKTVKKVKLSVWTTDTLQDINASPDNRRHYNRQPLNRQLNRQTHSNLECTTSFSTLSSVKLKQKNTDFTDMGELNLTLVLWLYLLRSLVKKKKNSNSQKGFRVRQKAN